MEYNSIKTIRKGIIIYSNVNILDEEIDAYIERGKEKLGERLRTIHINIEDNNEYANITYSDKAPDFERVRRITGYLVGTLDRFNDGKRAEESDRVKHEV